MSVQKLTQILAEVYCNYRTAH